MKNLIIYILIQCFAVTCVLSQDYWTQSYDPFEHEHEQILNLVLEDSIVYASARGTCFKDSILECFKMVKFDIDGNLLSGKEYATIENGLGLEIDDEWLYVDGGNEFTGGDGPIDTRIKLVRISKDFSESETLDTFLNFGTRITNRSSISNDSHVIVSGSYVELASTQRTFGLQVWVDKETFKVDTIIRLEPTRTSLVLSNMTVDESGALYTIATDRYLNEHFQELLFHRIIKQDSKGNIVWDIAYKNGRFNNPNYPSSIHVDKNNIYFLGFDQENDNMLVCLDTLGQIKWQYEFEHDHCKDFIPLNIVEKSNSNLLVVGTLRASKYGWVNVGYVAEIDKNNGFLIWDRVFEVDKGGDEVLELGLSKSNHFIDLVELEDGDLILGGELQDTYQDPNYGIRHDNDLWLVRLDAEGCLIENCGFLQTVNEGVLNNDTCKWLKDDASWCYSQFAFTPSQDLAQVEVFEDTLIGNRLCSILGLYDEGVFIEESRLICFYEEENEIVYFYEDEEFKLLYDFSFSVAPGDTVEYFLPKNFKFYDIASETAGFIPSQNAFKYRYIDAEWIEQDNGEFLRIIQTQPIPNDFGECFEMDRIIDGVGSDRGFMGKGCNSISGFESFFRNFESAELSYSEAEGCILTSVEHTEKMSVQIYPNPTKGILHLESPESSINSVKLYSSLGQLLLDKKVNKVDLELSLETFIDGVYWLDVQLQNGEILREKILVLQ